MRSDDRRRLGLVNERCCELARLVDAQCAVEEIALRLCEAAARCIMLLLLLLVLLAAGLCIRRGR